ncbi:MAG: hypothetical protein J6N19_09800 [Clostridium sp.]|nr:hypothetical protein [Clostridium sp.]
MPRYKITKSLIESWYYVHDCWEGCEDDAMESFLRALRCEPEELTDEQKQNIQNGHDFEELIESIANGADWETGKEHKWYRAAYELAQLVKDAQFQVRIRKPITVNGMDFEIVGVLDALREGTIFDFKFKNKSFGSLDLAGDYLDSAQHPFYFYLVPEARKFLYMVSDGNDIYIEQYFPEESRSAEEIIAEFISFLESSNLMDEYKAHWQIAA